MTILTGWSERSLVDRRKSAGGLLGMTTLGRVVT
jgi:hypothetical protein